jgi:tape measure domain-containing protein
MSSIDQRVVEMQFDNKAFGSGVNKTIGDLNNLKSGLKLEGAAKGIEEAAAAAGRFSLDGMKNSISSLMGGFSALQVTAITALSNITNKAVNAGLQLAKSMTIAPISAGFHEYELMMGSTQTILANTARYGTKLPEVQKNLNELNTYADQTIYDFGQMTQNIGLFTNAGIKIGDATSMIKGFSNEAAASGTNAEGAASAAYQLSQALSAGTIRLMDWRSLQNVGMGNKNMQDSLVQIADAMGTVSAHGETASKIQKNFNGSLEKGWLTADVMSKYLKIMAGDMTVAQMKTMGLSDAQIKSFQSQQKTAQDAATKVRTFTQLMGTIREAVGSGWTDTFRTLFGDFNEATVLFTNINNVVSGFVQRSANARNSVLKDWKAMGGRQDLILGLKDAFAALGGILGPIGKAFRDIFPRKTATDLVKLTYSFEMLMRSLVPSQQTSENLRRTFAGLFAVLDIGWQIIKAGVKFVADLLGEFGGGAGGILQFTGSIGDFLVALDKGIKAGDTFGQIFGKIGDVLKVPIRLLSQFGTWIGSLFAGFDTGNVTKALANFNAGLSAVADTGQKASGIWTKLLNGFKGFMAFFYNMATVIGTWFSGLAKQFSGGLGNINWDEVLGAIQTGLGAGLILVLKKLAASIKNFNLFGGKNGPGGFLSSFKDSLEGLTGTMKAMQQNLKATALLKIAGAIGILAVSLLIISTIPPARLAAATGAITVMFAQLAGALKAFDKVGSYGAIAKLDLMAIGLVGLGVALILLASAVKILSGIPIDQLRNGLIGITILIGLLAAGAKVLSKSSKDMIKVGLSMILMGVALNILVKAVKSLGQLDMATIGKGLAGLAGTLAALAIFSRLQKSGATGVADALSLLIMATAINVLANAVIKFATMSWSDMERGFTGLMVGLLGIAGALKIMPATSLMSALSVAKVIGALMVLVQAFQQMATLSWNDIAKGLVGIAGGLGLIALSMKFLSKINFLKMLGLLVVAVAIEVLANALSIMAALSWEQLAKGLVGLGISLAILVVAMRAMEGGLAGAAAMVVMAVALNMLMPVLMAFANMSIGQIAASLGMLAGVFTVIGLAGLILAPVVPVLLGLAASIALLGAAMLLAGVGVLAFATGLTLLAAAGAAGTAAIVAIVSGLVGLIPYVAQQIGLGIVAFAKVIAISGGAITMAITAVLIAFANAIIKFVPKAAQTMLVVLKAILKVIVTAIPQIVDAGMKVIIGFLDGIGKNIGKVVDKAADIIVNFLNGISRNIGRIIQAGVNLIISFVNGIADAIRKNGKRMSDAGWNLAKAIIDGMVDGVKNLASHVWDAVKNMAGGALDWARNILDSHSPSKEFIKIGHDLTRGFAIGIVGNKQQIHDAVQSMFTDIDNLTQKSKERMASANKSIADLRARNVQNAKDLAAAQKRIDQAEARDVTGKKASERKRSAQARQNAIDSAKAAYDRLLTARGKTVKQIADEKKVLAAATNEYKTSIRTHQYLKTQLDDEYARQKKLADQNDVLTQKIKDAKQALSDATKTRDDYNKSLQDQYGAQQAVAKDTSLNDYVKNLQQQIVDTQKFSIAIQELRKRGLNNEMYQQLLGTGLDAMPFMQQLLAGGKSAVQNLNTLGSSLDKAAAGIGKSASSSLYQAAVDSAAGLVKGLQSQQKNIQKQMDQIADYMVARMKKALRIKSPSEVFAELGAFTAQGMAQGLEANATAVGRSAEVIGNTAIDSMKKTIAGLGSAVNGDMDMNPVISPVLDLSNVQKGASQIGSMLASKPLTVDTTKARDASAAYAANQRASTAAATAEPPAPLTFIQNNMSPKALSRAEIYRQTNNQISRAKGALTSNARPS